LKGLPCGNKGVARYSTLEAAFMQVLRLNPSQLVQDSNGNGVNSAMQVLKGRQSETEKQKEATLEALLLAPKSKALAARLNALETKCDEIKAQIEIEAAKTVASVGSAERIAEIQASLGSLKTDQALRARVQAWIRETVNSVTLDKTQDMSKKWGERGPAFKVDLKSGNVIEMDLSGNIKGTKSLAALFTMPRAVEAVETLAAVQAAS
jgi:hypothetical protein